MEFPDHSFIRTYDIRKMYGSRGGSIQKYISNPQIYFKSRNIFQIQKYINSNLEIYFISWVSRLYGIQFSSPGTVLIYNKHGGHFLCLMWPEKSAVRSILYILWKEKARGGTEERNGIQYFSTFRLSKIQNGGKK